MTKRLVINRVKKLGYVLIVVALTCVGTKNVTAAENQNLVLKEKRIILENISEKEKEILEVLSRRFLSLNDFGYVLFGNKPVALIGYLNCPSWEDPVIFKNYFPERNYWKTWKKYYPKLSSKKFILSFEKMPWGELVFLIRKEHLKKIILRNHDFFDSFIGHSNPEKILLEIESGKNFFSEILQKNEILLGILLGYGQSNAFFYAIKNAKFPLKQDFLPFYRYPKASLSPISFPSFLYCQSKETEEIYEQFALDRIQIQKYLENESCLKLFFEHFYSETDK